MPILTAGGCLACSIGFERCGLRSGTRSRDESLTVVPALAVPRKRCWRQAKNDLAACKHPCCSMIAPHCVAQGDLIIFDDRPFVLFRPGESVYSTHRAFDRCLDGVVVRHRASERSLASPGLSRHEAARDMQSLLKNEGFHGIQTKRPFGGVNTCHDYWQGRWSPLKYICEGFGDVSERRPTAEQPELIGSSVASGSPASSAVSGKMHVGHAVAANGV